MNMYLSHHSNGKRLPKEIRDYIRKRFMLTPEYVNVLRCFEYEGTVGEKPVRRFRIYDEKDAAHKKLVLKQIGDLDKEPGTVIFEGYIDKAGNAYAADRRVPPKRKITKLETEKKNG